MATIATTRPSAIAAFRAARERVERSASNRALGRRQPRPPVPPIPVSVATADRDAAAWFTVMTALTTSVSLAATAKLVATKNPAYAKIVTAATKLLATSGTTVTEIEAAGQAILAAGS